MWSNTNQPISLHCLVVWVSLPISHKLLDMADALLMTIFTGRS